MPQCVQAGLGARQDLFCAERTVPNAHFVYLALIRRETRCTAVIGSDKQVVRRRKAVLKCAACWCGGSLFDAIHEEVHSRAIISACDMMPVAVEDARLRRARRTNGRTVASKHIEI